MEEESNKKIVVLFGAGKWGKNLAELYKTIGESVDLFCDNDSRMWGKTVAGIPVISPEELYSNKKNVNIVVISKYAEEIECQLRQMGMEERIIKSYSVFWRAVYDIWPRLQVVCKVNNTNNRVVFLLANGLAMGGVETWTLSEGSNLKKLGKEVAVVYEEGKNEVLNVKDCDVLKMPQMSEMSVAEWYKNTIRTLLKYKPGTVVCNFGGENAGIGFLVKKIAGNNVRCVAVIHNDEDIYYDTYLNAKDEIDYCVTISEHIKEKMIKQGFPKEKMISLKWNLLFDESYVRPKRNKNQKIRIGYAGRITKTQKRLDYLETFLEQLKDKDVDFVISLAGDGDYLDELKSVVQNKRWNDYINLCGIVDSEEISEFWKNQDVMISFSEHEGHSISQCEAMSWGAVPVLTDVSGVRDDVTDGEEGFVVPVGNISMMVDAIVKLDSDRDLLYKMSNNARERIKKEHTNNPSIWEKIL